LRSLRNDMQQDPLSIQATEGKSPETRILTFEGPITLSNLFTFQAELRKETAPLVVLDLTGVPYMDSAGMGAVINYHISCQKAKRKLVLAGVNGRVHTLLELTNTDKLLTLVPTVADADSPL
jgi:anti-sigma B factor antagonist